MAFESTSFPSSSVRHRVLRRIFSNLNPKPFELDLPPLKPGEMQLYSYYTPGISTGLYDIVAEQTIHTSDGSQSKTIRALDQSFFVYAPKYSLDPALVHSTFPHQGVAAQANILPHVVLNDPHLPWQTEIGKTSEKDTLRIPWLAVIAFEQSELKLQPGDPLFPPSLQGDKSLPQSFTMTTRLTVGQLLSSGLQCALPALDEDLLEDPKLPLKSIDVIFPEMDLFLALFGGGTSDAPQIDLDRFKYLAHARKVNTTHMADSGVLDEGEFSIVFSHRTGPPFEKDASPEPKRCVAHLVSLDWIHRIPASGLKSNKRAAVISLFSWTYDCIPPETVDFEDVMRAVGKNNEVFRTPDEIRSKVNKDLPPAVHSRIKGRLDDGYTLARYRVQTGEETYALMRGPLTPYAVPDATWMDIHSNTGEDLQIIDTQLGLMDISYSAAWQLGKSLAIADQAFCAALIRIRADVYDKSSEKAKEKELSKKFEDATSKRVIDALPEHFSDMMQLSKQPFDQQRWDRPSLIQSRYQLLAEGKDTESYNEAIAHHLRRRVERLASATDGTHYTEAKDPLSTDWDLVLNWILDKIYLDRVPPWYLIPDPTWLPAESIRFFYVDHKWLSALVDGALSVANHLDKQDKVRQVIKDQLVKYLNEEIHPELKHPPQIPSYGFYLRSVVVDAFPDLVVRAPWPTRDGKPDLRAEVLRQENVRKDIMFCLLDRTPKDLQQLILSQPPHQQCFMFGHDSTFTNNSFVLELRKVYSVHTTNHMDELRKQPYSKGEDGRCEIYDWNTRTILVDKFAGLVSSTLDDAHKQDSEIYDGEANASLLGIELNDPIYRLTFFPPNQPPAALDDHLVAFSLPGEAPPATAPPATVPPILRNYARPFKGVARARYLPRGSPRRSGFPQPVLATAPPAISKKLQTPTKYVSASTEPTVTSILSTVDYDDMEECFSRFSANCFPIGSPSTAKDEDTKYLTSSTNGSDVIVSLSRNGVDSDSTDCIHLFEIRVPLGTAADHLFIKPLEIDSVEVLNTMRFTTDVGVDGNEIVIHLKPKAVSELSLLSHNPDMSVMIKGADVNPESLDSTISIVELYTSKQGNARVALNYIHHIQVKKE